MNIALVLSGGIGNRVGLDVPKQYIRVNGRTIISYCLEVLECCESIDMIQVVAEEEWHGIIQNSKYTKLRGFSKPGETRQLSIVNGLEDINRYADVSDMVIIHDAARPLVSKQLLENVMAAAKGHHGSIPVLKVKDTVYLSKDGRRILSLIDRDCIYAGQAPEAFVLGAYYKANKQLTRDEIMRINGSTEPAIMAGLDIAMVEGEEQNFKITTKEDLDRFEEIIKKG